jgi:hypothetical protein
VNWSELLEPIAAWFRSFGLPYPVVHWGHPLIMAIVVFVMASFVGLVGGEDWLRIKMLQLKVGVTIVN